MFKIDIPLPKNSCVFWSMCAGNATSSIPLATRRVADFGCRFGIWRLHLLGRERPSILSWVLRRSLVSSSKRHALICFFEKRFQEVIYEESHGLYRVRRLPDSPTRIQILDQQRLSPLFCEDLWRWWLHDPTAVMLLRLLPWEQRRALLHRKQRDPSTSPPVRLLITSFGTNLFFIKTFMTMFCISDGPGWGVSGSEDKSYTDHWQLPVAMNDFALINKVGRL